MPSAHRYLINFLLDATLGMLLIYAGVRTVSVLVEWQQWESLRFGEYGEVLQTLAGGASWRGLCAVPTQPFTRVRGVGVPASLPRLPLGGRRQETPSTREGPRRVPLPPEGMGRPTGRPQGPLPAACLRLSLPGPQGQHWRVHRLEPACLAVSRPWAGLPPSIWHTHSPGTPGPCYLQTQV